MKDSTKDLYGTGTDVREISLRNEMEGTRYGTPIEIEKMRLVLIRRMRRDAFGNLVSCPCTDPVTREPDKDKLCLVCLGEGFLWDEYKTKAYKYLEWPKTVQMPTGHFDVPVAMWFTVYNTLMNVDDKVVEVVLTADGQLQLPPQRLFLWKLQHVEPYRLDEGKVEFLKAWSYLEDTRHLNS